MSASNVVRMMRPALPQVMKTVAPRVCPTAAPAAVTNTANVLENIMMDRFIFKTSAASDAVKHADDCPCSGCGTDMKIHGETCPCFSCASTNNIQHQHDSTIKHADNCPCGACGKMQHGGSCDCGVCGKMFAHQQDVVESFNLVIGDDMGEVGPEMDCKTVKRRARKIGHPSVKWRRRAAAKGKLH